MTLVPLEADIRLTYPNLCWDASESSVFDQVVASAASGSKLQSPPLGQFALAGERDGGWYLVRDVLGINKLFYLVDRDRQTLTASSSFYDLAVEKKGMAAIRSVPPGHVVRVDGSTMTVRHHCYYDLSETKQASDEGFDVEAFQQRVRSRLTSLFLQLKDRFPDARFVVCLSGGLDSTVVASFARRHLPNVAAATFSYADKSDDFRAAEAISRALELDFLPVIADRTVSVCEVDELLKVCQDWRDFNVHCAWVNAAIGRDLSTRRGASKNLVLLTGDLMNEYVADYTPATYKGAVYYQQPRLNRNWRRRAFVFGLDTSDREVGVFHHYGLVTVQPYSVVAEDYLSVPARFLERPDCKEALNLALLGNPSVEALVTKTKIRAQVGGADGGTLGLFHDAGFNQSFLKARFDLLFTEAGGGAGVEPFIVAGRYRS